MKEIREIVTAFDQHTAEGRRTALASLVHVEGSSYRRPGARMLVNDEGQFIGAISGGCLEGDALRKSMLAITQQQSKLVTYDTSDEEDITVGVQLGCEGVIQVLIEPINPESEINPVSLLRKATAKRKKSVLVTLFSLNDKSKPQPGTCLLIEEDNTLTGEISPPGIREAVLTDAREVMNTEKSAFRNYISEDSTVNAFIEFIGPPVSLVIVGAGNDVIPLSQMADSLGWEVTVVDGRSSHAKQERFAGTCRVLVSKPEHVLNKLVIDHHTIFLLMTHNYNYDLAMLRLLVDHNINYIGVLGPKKKMDRMLNEIAASGTPLTEEQKSSIFGPVGLEIGAETPEEIAISILAEIKKVLTGKSGISLRNMEVIHSRAETNIEDRRVHL